MHEDIIRNAGLSVTRQRLEILQALAGLSEPSTVEDIGRRVDNNINTSTLYRSLQALVAAGIVYQTDFRDVVAYFELQDKHHHHVVCTNCRRRKPVSVCVDSKLPAVEKETGYTITSHVLELFGLCDDCSSS